MELIKKSAEEMTFVTDLSPTLANALRRSVGEIPILAIDEVDFYKNDSVLYDEILAHRLGLVPLQNQKLKAGDTIELKLKAKSSAGQKVEVLSESLGKDVVLGDIPLTLLENGQELELVARAKQGRGLDHAKFSPGIIFYKHVPKIKISSEGEKHAELAELYPEVFEFSGKLKVKNAFACELDQSDMKEFPGVSIEFDDKLVLTIESWGQIDAKDIFIESCKALKANLSEVLKEIK
jgi:DNA-directed RNA polymerase subunit D